MCLGEYGFHVLGAVLSQRLAHLKKLAEKDAGSASHIKLTHGLNIVIKLMSIDGWALGAACFAIQVQHDIPNTVRRLSQIAYCRE